MYTASQAASSAAVATSYSSKVGDSTSLTQPEPTAAQENHNQGPGDELGGDGASGANKAASFLTSDPRDAHPEPCLQGESAKTTITTASSRAAFSISPDRQGTNLGSLTSPESSPVQKQQDETPYKEDANLKDDRDSAHPEACPQEESTGTAIAAPSCSATNQPDVTTDTTVTSVTGPAQDKNDTSAAGDPIHIPDCDEDRPEPYQDTTPAIVSLTRRARTPRPFTTSTAHRGSHSVKMPRRAGGRMLRAHRAPPKPQPQQPSPTDPAVPAAHIFAEAPRAKTAICDMEGVPHVVGGLVEVSIGRKDVLFAKQVPKNSTDPYNTLEVERHPFTPFPPPDMGENNREFDMELEENRPIFEPFNQDIIDRQVDGWAAQTDLFARVMNAHQAEFDPVNELFLAQKAELEHLNNVRERAITAEFARPPLMSELARRKLITRVAAAEKPLLKELETTQRELKEIIIRGRVKIARGLQRDLRAPSVIDEKRARALQKIDVEEKETELGIAGGTIGLRGGLNEQDHATQTAILRYTRHVVDERLKVFDETDDSRVPDWSTTAPPESNVDTVISTVPEWFTILDARGTVQLYRTTPLDRFKELLQVIGNTSIAAREEQWADESRPNRHTWNQQFHKASPHWANELRRTRGGWWTCRSGPDAPPAERYCALCHDQSAAKRRPASAKERYQHILDEIDTAMEEAKERDQLRLKYQLQQERHDIDEYWHRREFVRSGGGVDITEVLHSRDVNELNYRPSTGRSQSWQEEGVSPRSQELLDKAHVTGQASAPQSRPSPPSQHSQSSQLLKYLSGTPSNDYYSLPSGLSQSPPNPNGSGFYESLLGRQLNASPSRPAVPSQSARLLRGSPLFHELLAGRQTDTVEVLPGQVAPPQAVPPQLLHRHNSSQAHDLLHGRDATENSAQAGRPQLRSSLAPPGPKNKPQKRVSWQF
ncbi:hypothetical protein N657DRAFT_567277 [Parathielavia appendiculata]|uniref:Uncharacterized protein n=1 Tax=Parathielavia appendiculata TaxID=2587402 RepID=A0AAN6U4M2_9PEZI|nr:hypothetical protein N657DRAFT_567277 [Parathielavia appendiculata]